MICFFVAKGGERDVKIDVVMRRARGLKNTNFFDAFYNSAACGSRRPCLLRKRCLNVETGAKVGVEMRALFNAVLPRKMCSKTLTFSRSRRNAALRAANLRPTADWFTKKRLANCKSFLFQVSSQNYAFFEVLMHFVQALTFFPSISALCKFTLYFLGALLLAWLTVFPSILPFPQTSHTLLISFLL